MAGVAITNEISERAVLPAANCPLCTIRFAGVWRPGVRNNADFSNPKADQAYLL
jgi:hypothetical protein